MLLTIMLYCLSGEKDFVIFMYMSMCVCVCVRVCKTERWQEKEVIWTFFIQKNRHIWCSHIWLSVLKWVHMPSRKRKDTCRTAGEEFHRMGQIDPPHATKSAAHPPLILTRGVCRCVMVSSSEYETRLGFFFRLGFLFWQPNLKKLKIYKLW